MSIEICRPTTRRPGPGETTVYSMATCRGETCISRIYNGAWCFDVTNNNVTKDRKRKLDGNTKTDSVAPVRITETRCILRQQLTQH